MVAVGLIWCAFKCDYNLEMLKLSLKLTVGGSSLTAEGSHVLRDGVSQQQAHVHWGAPLHCQRGQEMEEEEGRGNRKVELCAWTKLKWIATHAFSCKCNFLTFALHMQPYMSRWGGSSSRAGCWQWFPADTLNSLVAQNKDPWWRKKSLLFSCDYKESQVHMHPLPWQPTGSLHHTNISQD